MAVRSRSVDITLTHSCYDGLLNKLLWLSKHAAGNKMSEQQLAARQDVCWAEGGETG